MLYFFVQWTTNPHQIHNFTTIHAQQIHKFTTSRTACCTTNPQQIHNKLNKWSLSFSAKFWGLETYVHNIDSIQGTVIYWLAASPAA
jgi:hypothetical protein